jgi:hypothetical protein
MQAVGVVNDHIVGCFRGGLNQKSQPLRIVHRRSNPK